MSRMKVPKEVEMRRLIGNMLLEQGGLKEQNWRNRYYSGSVSNRGRQFKKFERKCREVGICWEECSDPIDDMQEMFAGTLAESNDSKALIEMDIVLENGTKKRLAMDIPAYELMQFLSQLIFEVKDNYEY